MLTATTAPTSGLAQRARQAILWTTGLHVFRDVVQFGLMLVLVRLLPAEAYGHFGFVNALIGFLVVFSFREFVAHTVVVRDDAAVNYQHHFTAGLVIQSALFTVANLIAFALRWFPSYSAVAPFLHVMSVVFLLDLPSELRVKMLERSMDWRRLRSIEAAGLAFSSLGAIALAAAGAGAYALLVPALLYPALLMIDLFAVQRWRPTFEFRREDFRASQSFGLARVGSASLVSLSGLLESWSLARVVGFAGLGVFGRATGLSLLVCHRVAFLLMSSVFPVLTRMEGQSYQRAAGLVLRAVAWFVIPAALLFALLAEPVVQTLYGDRWLQVVPLVPWAMAVGSIVAVVHTAYFLLLGHQHQRACLIADAWRLVGMSIALGVALPFGITTYLQALAGVHLVALALIVRLLVSADGLDARDVLVALGPAAFAATCAAVVLVIWRHRLPASLAGLPLLVSCGAAFAATYLLVLRLLFRRELCDLVSQLPEGQRLNRWLRLAPAVS